MPDGFAEQLRQRAAELGKKQSRIVFEAVQDYFDLLDAESETAAYERGEYAGLTATQDEMEARIKAKLASPA
jgi:predicted transcriptional regulator